MLKTALLAAMMLVVLSLPADARHARGHVLQASGEIIGGRPAGCPRAFCGCGASLHVFGRIIPALNRAASWFRFPRAAPGPGMAAVRRHHVFVLEQHVAGDTWLAYDANSGGHMIRLHARSIAGYVIVDPRALIFGVDDVNGDRAS
jgi:hypothetical protein